MSSVDTATYRSPTAIKPLTPATAAIVPNPLGQRLRIHQRLGANVYVADCAAESAARIGLFSRQQVVIKTARLQRTWAATSANGRASLCAWQELRIARQLRLCGGHRNVITVLEAHVHNNTAFVVMEYCTGGDLFSHLVRHSTGHLIQHDALRKIHQIASGLRFLHEHNIAHRDLSLENILVDDDGVCKIGDFGLSTRADALCNQVVGKTQYAAPEVVQGEWYDPVRADLWSLGIVLFMMLTGSPLVQFASTSCPEFKALQVVGVRGVLHAWGIETQLSAATINLLSRLLQINPIDRVATAQEVLMHAAFVFADCCAI